MVRTLFVAALLLAPLALVSADDRKDKERKDSKDDSSKKLVGTWKVTACEKDGKAEASSDVKGRTVKITGDTITCYDKNDKVHMACTYKLDTSSKPWKIELKCTEGEHKGKTLKGIAKLDGDTLKVCHGKPDGDAPSSFDTKKDQCCLTLERAKR